jgi:hypothetical protein
MWVASNATADENDEDEEEGTGADAKPTPEGGGPPPPPQYSVQLLDKEGNPKSKTTQKTDNIEVSRCWLYPYVCGCDANGRSIVPRLFELFQVDLLVLVFVCGRWQWLLHSLGSTFPGVPSAFAAWRAEKATHPRGAV